MDKVRYNLTLEKIKKDWQCANTLPQLNERPSPPFFLMPLRNIPKIKGADTAFPGNRNSFQSPLRKSHPWKEMWILWNGHHSLDSWYKVPCGFFFLVLETVGPMWEGETLYSRQNNTKEMATNDSDRSMPLYNIDIQILQTDLHTFPLRISPENLITDQGISLWWSLIC